MTVFVGRGDELTRLRLFLEPPEPPGAFRPNVLIVTGESGIGKTRLVEQILQEYRREMPPFVQLRMSARGKDWIFFVTELAAELRRALGIEEEPARARPEELEELIIEQAAREAVLLVVDDVVALEEEPRRFFARFARAERSRALLISTEAPKELPSNCLVLPLQGLATRDQVKLLLGETLAASIDRGALWHLVDQLRGNPYKLLRLRDLEDPRDTATLEEHVRSLIDPSINELRAVAEQYEHFAALGSVREPTFEEDLFAYLWDRLGHGGTELYVQIRQQLIDRNLLIPQDPGSAHKLRINGGAHRKLRELLQTSKKRSQALYVEYFLAVYYRNRFLRQPRNASLRNLENYVYHAVRSGRVSSAYSHLFDTDVFESTRRKGLSLQLKPILVHLREGLLRMAKDIDAGDVATETTEVSRDLWSVMWATVNMELGRIFKDLNEPRICLDYLHSAREEARRLASYRLMAQINHLRGIAHSVLGETRECLESYEDSFQVIKEIAPEPLDALTLGYYAYELKFLQLDRAGEVAQGAIDFARFLGDKAVEMKNLCTLGQILSFACKFKESMEALVAAEALTTEVGDVRELCRVKINAMVTHIGQRRHDEALARLSEARERFGETGDRRRLLMGQAYEGIIRFKEGRESEGRDLVKEAMVEHEKIGAVREAIYEAYTWRWMARGKTEPEDNEVKRNLALGTDHKKLYRDFWESCYKPALLES